MIRIGLDIGGTGIQIGAVDENNEDYRPGLHSHPDRISL